MGLSLPWLGQAVLAPDQAARVFLDHDPTPQPLVLDLSHGSPSPRAPNNSLKTRHAYNRVCHGRQCAPDSPSSDRAASGGRRLGLEGESRLDGVDELLGLEGLLGGQIGACLEAFDVQLGVR